VGERPEPKSGLRAYFEPLRSASQRYQLSKHEQLPVWQSAHAFIVLFDN